MCLRVCISPPPKFLNRLLDFDEVLYGDVIEGDLYAILFNSIASTIPKWRTFNFLKPRGNYMCHLLYQSLVLYFVFVGFI
jgi:hypothetical protein